MSGEDEMARAERGGIGENNLSALHVEIRNLNGNVLRLTNTVDLNTRQLAKLEVLENNHDHQSAALERAFKAVERVDSMLSSHIADEYKKHAGYDKYIWLTTGFVLAVSVMWSVIGYRINAQVDETLRAVSEMKLHIITDKITSPEDVQKHDKHP